MHRSVLSLLLPVEIQFPRSRVHTQHHAASHLKKSTTPPPSICQQRSPSERCRARLPQGTPFKLKGDLCYSRSEPRARSKLKIPFPLKLGHGNGIVTTLLCSCVLLCINFLCRTHYFDWITSYTPSRDSFIILFSMERSYNFCMIVFF
jgi:hypothetical protein